ncbi:MAG: metallophosphoesterase [Lachnospiraceae bacterium]
MSIYLTSDLHGDLESFRKLLRIVRFDIKEDKMYILGDLLDRGPQSMELLSFVMKNIINGSMDLLKGNHELFAQMFLEKKLEAYQWIKWGGEQTYRDICKLTKQEKSELYDFLSGLKHYKVINSNGKRLVLTHSGLDADNIVLTDQKIDVVGSIEQAVCNDEFKYLTSNDLYYMPAGRLKCMDGYLIVGHIPTMKLNEDSSCNLYRNNYYMCIDTGAGFRDNGGKMSFYRLDDGKVFMI